MGNKIGCWGNPFIQVDLGNGDIRLESVSHALRQKFIGGRGLGDWYLSESGVQPGKTDPLGPQNMLFVAGGLLNGTDFPGASRTFLISLNPLTGGWGESSSGGSTGIALKKAGFDGIVITGASLSPVYLWIDDDVVELRDATFLSGCTTFEAASRIKEAHGDADISTMTIGPAGEKLVRFACVNSDNRYHGRCGLGAVMGSKRLKAIAVRGTGTVTPEHPEEYSTLSDAVRACMREDPVMSFMATHGPAATVEAFMEAGLNGVRNFQRAYWAGIRSIGYDAVKKYYRRSLPCPTDCPAVCDRLVEIDQGDCYAGTWTSAMEATPAYNFAHFEIDDINTVIRGFSLCNAYGIDIHSWSNVMQWAIECFERGILTREDTDSLALRWGDGPLLLDSIERISLRQGKFGDCLAEGVARAAKRIGRGSHRYAMQMKGMEIDDEIRVCKGFGLGMLTELRGPGHVLASWWGEFDESIGPERAKELFGSQHACDPHTWQDKPELVYFTERQSAIGDSLGICLYGSQRHGVQMMPEYNMGTLAEAIRAAVGWTVSEDELWEIGDRLCTLEKSFNVLAGLTRQDDYPPERFFEPLEGDKFAGWKLEREDVDRALRRHDELHGWDSRTGIPTAETLQRLGLTDVAARLINAGMLTYKTENRAV